VKILSPTFGGINLEDISAPDCFEIEERLKAELNIPIMHDDQHGTAIVSAAALLNALELTGKKIEEIKVKIGETETTHTISSFYLIDLGFNKFNLPPVTIEVDNINYDITEIIKKIKHSTLTIS